MRDLHYPALVLPTHSDNFLLPYETSQVLRLRRCDLFCLSTSNPFRSGREFLPLVPCKRWVVENITRTQIVHSCLSAWMTSKPYLIRLGKVGRPSAQNRPD